MQRIIIQITENQIKEIDLVARISGNSRASVIRTAINEYLINHDSRQSLEIIDKVIKPKQRG